MREKTMVAVVSLLVLVGVSTRGAEAGCTSNCDSCEGWPTGTVDPTGEPIEDHSSHNWSCEENWASAPDSDVTIEEHQLYYTKDVWNMTEDPVNWSHTDTSSTTHAWEVSGSVRADLKAGLLTKIVADAKIGVEVGGAYSGSKAKTRSVTIDTIVQACRGKGRRDYTDKYSATVSIDWGDRMWSCSDGHAFYGIALNPHTDSSSTGNGDTNDVTCYIDLGPWSQSTNPCFHCYVDP